MKQIVAIGEALIDFIPQQKGCDLKDVSQFRRVCGGAPCNVTAAVAKLGGQSRMITQLGNDAFGDYIVDTLNEINVNTDSVLRTSEAATALAFVSLKADGNRDFSFYRKPSADMLFKGENLQEEWFENICALHFCSVDLIPSDMREAHREAISRAIKNGGFISFDPNIRFPLWEDKPLLKSTILEFMNYADIAKISDEELEFITSSTDVCKAIYGLFSQYKKLKAVLYSCGKDGAKLYLRNTCIVARNYDVKAVDTTGAGDSIIGAFLYCLADFDCNANNFDFTDIAKLQGYMDFANAYSSLSVQSSGAISSYSSKQDVLDFMK